MADINLLTAGLYTVPEVARLVGAPINRVRGWITGYPRTKAEPVIRNDVGWMNGTLTMSFANLMEVRFIQIFAGFGVRAASLRMMAAEAQRLLNHPHPFATSTVFTTDGRKIFAVVEERAGDKHLYDLRAKNWAFFEVIALAMSACALSSMSVPRFPYMASSHFSSTAVGTSQTVS